jgi:Icc-related predicted phosphoesterase
MSASGPPAEATVRIAAAGDVHSQVSRATEIAREFESLAGSVDLVLLAGDLTTHGEVEEGEVLAAACERAEAPVVAVLGNHDWHLGHQDEIRRVLESAGARVLDRESAVFEIGGYEVGVVGTKGFVGGFGASHLPDFGEPLLREVYAETTRDVDALERGLHEIATCPFRVVLLHYAPTESTLVGERPEIWTFLGTDRLAAPIVQHQPDLVVHGHAHAGRAEGRIGDVVVHNVSVPVLDRSFAMFELKTTRPAAPIH